MSIRKLAGQTLIYGMSSIVGRFITWFMSFVYAHLFADAGQFGIFSDLYAWVSYPLVVLTFGMETAFFRYAGHKTDADAAYGNAFATVAALTGGFTLLCLLLTQALANALDYPGHPELIRVLVGITALDVLSALPMARLRYRERPMRFASIHLLNIGLFVVGSLVLLVGFDMGVAGVFYANLLASAVRLALALVGNLPGSWRLHRPTLVPMLAYGAMIMVTGLSGQLNEMLDKNLLPDRWPDGKAFAGAARTGLELNGIYSACYKLGMVVMLAAQAYRYAAEPYFFRLAGERNSPYTIARVFHYFLMACLCTFVVTASFAFEIVSFNGFGLLGRPLLPPEYWPGAAVVPVILLANICLAAYLSLSIWYKLTEQLRFGLLFSAIGTAITFGLNWWLIPVYGYWASAWAHLLCYGTMAVLSYRFGQQHYPVPYRMGRLLLYMAAALAVYGVNQYLTTAFGSRAAVVLVKMATTLACCAAIVLAEMARPAFRANHTPA